jgi:hypothetical protein
MQLPSVPRMITFAAVILLLGLAGVLQTLGMSFAEAISAAVAMFRDARVAGPPTTRPGAALLPLVDVALHRLF